jgi:2-methylisocitrate lyase-like PEP mutase family enzyme
VRKPRDGRRRLRALLAGREIIIVPGVTNVLDGRSAERTGFDAVFVTGAGIANSLFGYPDIGLLTLTEMVGVTRRIAAGVGVPVIADADAGYGNHLNVMRTIAEFEHAGAAGIVIEDQVAPKQCGHFAGKSVVEPIEMIEKIVAARRARVDPELVLIARTDAIAVEGLDSALSRAESYAEAGADVIFVEAPRTVEEMAEIAHTVERPCLANIVEGGLTPLLSASELQQLGFRIALYANLALRVGSTAVNRAFASLRDTGSSAASLEEMLSWEDRQRAVDLPRWRKLDAEIADEARRLRPFTQPNLGGNDGR